MKRKYKRRPSLFLGSLAAFSLCSLLVLLWLKPSLDALQSPMLMDVTPSVDEPIIDSDIGKIYPAPDRKKAAGIGPPSKLEISGKPNIFLETANQSQGTGNDTRSGPSQRKTLIWWTMREPLNFIIQCDIYQCLITSDRTMQSEAAGVLFYASRLELGEFPLPRQPWQLWGLLHEESPRNMPVLIHERVLRHFNFTSTFSRYSDLPLTHAHLEDEKLLTSQVFMTPVGEKTLLRKEEKLAPIVYIASDCLNPVGRDQYVRELMSYIEVDSYGDCLNNRRLPPILKIDHLNNLFLPELLRFVGRYKFIITIENAVCDDYITEKLWRALIAGSIPIYFGTSTVRDWQPNNKSIINIRDFSSPKALADFIRELDQNDTEYNTYLDHKFDKIQPIANVRLREWLKIRQHVSPDGFFKNFECGVCQRAHKMRPKEVRIANQKHYNCPDILAQPQMNVSQAEVLDMVFKRVPCTAKWLDEKLMRNSKSTETDFDYKKCEVVRDKNFYRVATERY